MDKLFNYELLKTSNLKEINNSFFNKNIYPEIDTYLNAYYVVNDLGSF